MSSSSSSNVEFYSTNSSPRISPGASSSVAGAQGARTSIRPGANNGTPPSIVQNAKGTITSLSPLSGDNNGRVPLRHDSVADFWRDKKQFTVRSTGRLRSSFSFGGDDGEGTRQHSPQAPNLPPAVPSLPQTHISGWIHRILSGISSFPSIPCTPKAYRAAEWCDYNSTPTTIRQACQNVLTKQWTRTLPLFQHQSPAVTACSQLSDVIQATGQLDEGPLEVFEFCAGSGGPTPVFEQQINEDRRRESVPPLQFYISDLHPNPAAWKEHTSKSEHLRVIEEAVDATNPPVYARRCSSL
jgi:hypothetical protein